MKIEPFQERALLKGMAPDYRKRFQTVGEFMNALRTASPSPLNDASKFISSIAFLSVGALMSAYLFFFALDMLVNESTSEQDFIFALLAGGISTACLGAFIFDLVQFRGGQRPKFLNDFFRQDVALSVHVVCTIMFLFLAFVYSESWDDSFIAEIQFALFLNTDLDSDVADALVNVMLVFYALISVAGVWLGRKLLRRSV